MPRYFFRTANGIDASDEESVELPDRDALRRLLRQRLTRMLHNEADETGANAFTAKVYDEDGRLVMRAQASFVAVD